MSSSKIKVSFKKYPDDPVNRAINVLRCNFSIETLPLSFEDAKKVQAAFKDVVYIDDGESKFWSGGRMFHFFHVEGLKITKIKTAKYYGLDPDTICILQYEEYSLEDPFRDYVELKEGDLESIEEQLKEMNRYDILLKLEI